MKTFRIIGLILFAILLCMPACSGGDEPIEPTPKPEVIKSEITIDSSIITNGLSFTNEKGEQSISFSTNENWTLSVASTTSGATWCTASATNGTKGSASVKFNVTENTTYDDRSVSVTIKSGSATKTFTISQKGVDALLVTTNKYEIAQEGGKIEVEVKANIDYQISISESAKDWITESQSRALTSSKHIFDIALNEENEKREGEITFKSGDKVETVKVYQAGGPIILLSQNEYTISDAGDTISVEVKSNIEFGVQMPDVDWITDEASSRGMSSHTLKYIVSPNEGYNGRSASIVFYDKNSELKDTLEITQVQKDAIILSKKEYDIRADGGILEVDLNANVEFEYIIPDSCKWITRFVDKSRGLEEYKLLFSIDKNEDLYLRSSTLKFISKEKSVVDSINVVQLGKMKEVYVKEAGTLHNLIPEKEKWTTKAIKISGTINGTDIRVILEMIGYSNDPESLKEGVLTTLDISDAKIVEEGDYYYMDWLGKKYYTKNDQLSDYMFWYSNLQHIVLPRTITTVGKYSLGWCYELQTVKLFDEIVKLDDRAFCDCPKLHSINIPSGVTFIGEQTFAGSNIKSIIIPNTVTYIGKEAFCNSGLISVEIPISVKFMGDGIFHGCTKLKEFHGVYASKDNKCLIYNDTLKNYAIGCNESIYRIPTEVVTIGEKAFAGSKKLTSIVIPNCVKRIENEAFKNVPLTTIEIPNSIEYLGDLVLMECNTLKAIYGKYASQDNKCLIYNNAIIKYAIAANDETYEIPNGIQRIGEYAFLYAKLKSVKLPNSVTNIDNYAFLSCKKMENIDISDNLLTVGDYAFTYCFNLSSIELPDKVSSIGQSAFFQCEKLTTFKIPKSLEFIGEGIFDACKNLKEIYCYPTEPPTVSPKTSSNYGYSLGWIDPIVFVPKGCIDKYKYSDFAYGYTIKEM